VVGGKVVYAKGVFKSLDAPPPPPAMPDWSPVRSYGGYAAWGAKAEPAAAMRIEAAAQCSCTSRCGVHGHDHASAWSAKLPISDLKAFWGALGCACWAV
jgi:hypothetical protein